MRLSTAAAQGVHGLLLQIFQEAFGPNSGSSYVLGPAYCPGPTRMVLTSLLLKQPNLLMIDCLRPKMRPTGKRRGPTEEVRHYVHHLKNNLKHTCPTIELLGTRRGSGVHPGQIGGSVPCRCSCLPGRR